MAVRAEKLVMTAPELTQVLQKHFRQFVAGVRFITQADGEVALEINFKQNSLPLRVANGPR